MAFINKNLKKYKYGLQGFKKKQRLNSWRFFFSGLDEFSGTQQMFLLEFIMVNPWNSPSKVRICLEGENRPDISFEDEISKKTKLKENELPSYCCIRICKLGKEPKHLCKYVTIKDVNFSKKPFSVSIGDNIFAENRLQGRICVSERDGSYKSEYMCDKGYAVWDLSYEVHNGFAIGFNDESRWFPSGIHTFIWGKVLFDGVEYKVKKDRSYGYSERYWGKTYPSPWFHLSANELISEYSGRPLTNSSFAVQGIFDGKLSFIGHINDLEIIFKGDSSKNNKKITWDCVKMPETDKEKSNMIHWSCSFPVKNWVIDIDVYCKLNDLLQRIIEMPDPKGGNLKLLSGFSDSGEIKLYKRNGANIEQIEHARFRRCVCEYGAKKKKY